MQKDQQKLAQLIQGKKVAFIGAGVSHKTLIKEFVELGAHVTLCDQKKSVEDFGDYAATIRELGIDLSLGENYLDGFKGQDIIMRTPGFVGYFEKPLQDAMAAGTMVTSEVELFFDFCPCEIVAVTGSDGKTTTTTLTGEIMKAHFGKDKTFVVGNIGNPYTLEADKTSKDSVTVGEISSFQLETIHTFHPVVSAILNITPDHLNRHHTMECYIETKESITKNQTAGDTCVLNYEDEVLRRFGETLQTKVVFFSSKRRLEKGLYLDGEDIFYADGTTDTKVINVNELNILGKHNYENVMAAVGMSVSFGVPMDKIVEVLKRFQAVEHRIEYVTEKRGVKFYNDSKGTNPDAAIQGIRAMNRPTLLIGGGYDKQSEYDEWIESFDGKVKKLVLIGQTKEKIAECAKKHGFEDVILCDTFEEAIDTCYANAVSGDAVLLSPACASWGMFANYEERGRIFKEYVRNLAE